MQMTPEELEREINKLLVHIETKAKRFDKALDLLRQANQFVIAHYQRSAVGTGQGARRLMNEIETFLSLK
jgi:hypothetical protein